jgi:hypothetical protein
MGNLVLADILGWVAAAIAAFGYAWYAYSIYAEKSGPSRVTWFGLAVISIILAITNYGMGVTPAWALIVVNAVGAPVIALMTIHYGKGGWERGDRVAIATIVVSGFVWFSTESLVFTTICALAADAAAMSTTVVKAYRSPQLEALGPWSVTVLSCTLGVLALLATPTSEWGLDSALTPVYLLLVNGLILALSLRQLPRFATFLRAA